LNREQAFPTHNKTGAAVSLLSIRRVFRVSLAMLAAGVGFCGVAVGSSAKAAESSDASRSAVTDWLFPLSPLPADPPSYDNVTPLHIPRSKNTFTEAQLNNLFSAADWFPQSHTVMPDIVARGRPPEVYACGYCHTPSGQGRPENASLAGLPAAYIVQQLADFKSGARRSASCLPSRRALARVSAASLCSQSSQT
jgi:hypothetical protein